MSDVRIAGHTGKAENGLGLAIDLGRFDQLDQDRPQNRQISPSPSGDRQMLRDRHRVQKTREVRLRRRIRSRRVVPPHTPYSSLRSASSRQLPETGH